jgi:hypothetical protein
MRFDAPRSGAGNSRVQAEGAAPEQATLHFPTAPRQGYHIAMDSQSKDVGRSSSAATSLRGYRGRRPRLATG